MIDRGAKDLWFRLALPDDQRHEVIGALAEIRDMLERRTRGEHVPFR